MPYLQTPDCRVSGLSTCSSTSAPSTRSMIWACRCSTGKCSACLAIMVCFWCAVGGTLLRHCVYIAYGVARYKVHEKSFWFVGCKFSLLCKLIDSFIFWVYCKYKVRLTTTQCWSWYSWIRIFSAWARVAWNWGVDLVKCSIVIRKVVGTAKYLDFWSASYKVADHAMALGSIFVRIATSVQ